MTRPNQFGDDHLVAYLVTTTPSAMNITHLRRSLAEMLPSYMIPSVFVQLDTLPMTPTGKVNRQALPEPDTGRPELDTPFVAPQEPLEIALAEIWTEVLGIHNLGVNDNFFELGGHSLLATQIISRIQQSLEIDLPLPVLFNGPTIAEVALNLEESIMAEIEALPDFEPENG